MGGGDGVFFGPSVMHPAMVGVSRHDLFHRLLRPIAV
jgi:hypothetical protein